LCSKNFYAINKAHHEKIKSKENAPSIFYSFVSCRNCIHFRRVWSIPDFRFIFKSIESRGKSAKKITICLIPKKKGLPYFTSCAEGAREAAIELGNVELIYDGPTDGSPEKQASMIEQYTLKGVDVIAVSPNDPNVVAPALRKARAKGIHVISWDADAIQDSRDFFVNQATAEAIAYGMVDTMVKDLGGPETQADVAIVTAYLTAANQNVWIEHMKHHIDQKYSNLNLVAIKPSDEDQKLAFKVTQDLMKAYPDIKGFFGISSVSFPGAAEAVKQAGKSGEGHGHRACHS
jgi:rhamnose transport system substrate-binding protein